MDQQEQTHLQGVSLTMTSQVTKLSPHWLMEDTGAAEVCLVKQVCELKMYSEFCDENSISSKATKRLTGPKVMRQRELMRHDGVLTGGV